MNPPGIMIILNHIESITGERLNWSRERSYIYFHWHFEMNKQHYSFKTPPFSIFELAHSPVEDIALRVMTHFDNEWNKLGFG